VGEATSGGFELMFAAFLDDAPDVQSFAKNYLAVGFRIDYVRANGDLRTTRPTSLFAPRMEPSGSSKQGARGDRSPAEDGPAQAMVRRRDVGGSGRWRLHLSVST
jgi:hypothetical protein